ncbi:Beta-sarcoglycan [Sergentomyia squamirostris]
MTNFENTFVRSSSPQFSDDGDDSAMATLPIGDVSNYPQSSTTHTYNPPKVLENEIDYLKGRNTCAFWVLVILLLILTIGNLALTLTIVGILRLGRGMEFMELVPEAETIKFYGIADLDRITKRDGHLEGFTDVPMTVTGDGGSVLVNLINRNGHVHNKFQMGRNGTYFRGINLFEIRDPVTKETIFSTTKPRYNIPNGVANLKANTVSASRVTSPIESPLSVQTKGKLILRGAEGTDMEGKEILWTSDQNIFLKSINGSIVLSGTDGVYVDMKNIPIVQAEHGLRAGSMQFKVCVCMPQGKLFRVPIPRTHNGKGGCTHFNPRHDPCN